MVEMKARHGDVKSHRHCEPASKLGSDSHMVQVWRTCSGGAEKTSFEQVEVGGPYIFRV